MKAQIAKFLSWTGSEPLVRRVYGWLKPRDIANQYELQLLQILKSCLRPDSNCIDIGCHRGSVLHGMARHAPRGTHFAFEPIPDLIEGLRKTFKNNPRVRIYDLALSDRAGNVQFQHVKNRPAFSGFRTRTYPIGNAQVAEITVKTDLLDNVIPADIPIRLMKVDVEGAELEVFRGGVQTIRRNKPIILFEHGLGAADLYGTSPEDVHDLLVGECGLNISLMKDWLKDRSASGFSKEEFARQFREGINYYFIAAPPGAGLH